jgi:hypothetical protein
LFTRFIEAYNKGNDIKRGELAMRRTILFLLLGIVFVNGFGQSKRKRGTTKRADPEVIRPCGVRLTKETVLAAGTVGGSPWILAATSHEQNFYYNRNWICDQVVIKVWVKAVSPDADNSAPSSMSLYELKCKANQIRVTQNVEYDKDGKVQTSDVDYRAKWKGVVPESVGESILNTVCGKKSD